jgi:methyl-accepting chemotaxis protein
MRVQLKILSIVAILGASVVAVAGLGMRALESQNERLLHLDNLAQRAYYAETINTQIMSVTASNRGVIAARDRTETDDYIREAEAGVARMTRLVEDWGRFVPAAQAATFDAFRKAAAVFGRQRLDLARYAAEHGAAKGMDKLKEPEVRAARQALQKALDRNVADVTTSLAELRAGTAEFTRSVILALAASTLLALVVGVSIAAWIGTREIARPLVRVTEALRRMAAGDLSIDVDTHQRRSNDEIGALWATTGRFRAALCDAERLKEEHARTEEAQAAQRRRLLAEVADDFERSVGGVIGHLATATGEMMSAASEMARVSDDTAHQLHAVATASEESSVNVQTVASAAEELSVSVAEIGRRVEESARIAADAETRTAATSAKVGRLAESADRIGAIIGLISSIAEQTNLLALNATIEAARAGDAGRGFAVVAAEVKNLAGQTGKATGEIAAQISEIQAATADSAEAIGSITEVIRDLDTIAGSITESVRRQSNATTEIARNVAEASRGTALVSENIEVVNRNAGASSATSGRVLSAARELVGQGEELKRAMTRMLGTIRAA